MIGAITAALLVWAVAALGLGIELRSPVFDGSGTSFEIGPATVGMVAMIASLSGWALLAALERITRHAARIWTALAVLVLAASLSMPLGGVGLDSAHRTALVAMHLAVAAVLIASLPSAALRARAAGVGR